MHPTLVWPVKVAVPPTGQCPAVSSEQQIDDPIAQEYNPVRIFPPELQIGEEEGFTPEKDLFNRADFGLGLSNLVKNVTDPMVIALSGQWGSGKTTFLKMWAGELRKDHIPVIYFDAFANDFSGDAFAALAGEVVGLMQEKKKLSQKKGKEFIRKATAVGKVLGRSGFKLAVQAATAGVIRDVGLTSMSGDVSSEMAGLADTHIGELITNQNRNRELILEFTSALSELPELLANPKSEESTRPLVFIIDELDRCRPVFALELLERIKHFFNVSNVHFILGVNLDQLSNSVNAAYGDKVDAALYLQKFIHLSYQLSDEARQKNERNIGKYLDYLIEVMEFNSEDRGVVRDAAHIIGDISELKSYSFRTVDRIMSTLAATMAFTNKDQCRPGVIIGGLCIFKVMFPNLFQLAKEGRLHFSDVSNAFEMHRWMSQDGTGDPYMANLWTAVTDENASSEIRGEFEYEFRQYRIRRLIDVPQILANKIVDPTAPHPNST